MIDSSRVGDSLGDSKPISFFRSLVLSGLSFFGGSGLNLLAAILTARLLGPSGRGALAAIQTLPPMMIFIACLGNQVAIPTMIARSEESPDRIFGNVLSLLLLLFPPLLIFGAMAQFFVLKEMGEEAISAGMFFLLTVPVNVILGLSWSVFQGFGKFRQFSFLRILPVLSYVIAISLGAIWFEKKILTTTVIYFVLLVGACIPITYQSLSKEIRVRLTLDLPVIKKLMRIGLPSMYSLGFLVASQALPQLFISHAFGARELGLYSAGSAIGSILVLTGTVIGTVFFPRIASSAASNPGAGPALLGASGFAVLVFLILFFLASFLTKVIFGAEFVEGVGITRVLLIGALFQCINNVHADTYRAMGLPKVPRYGEGLALVIGCIGYVVATETGASVTSYSAICAGSYLAACLVYCFADMVFVFPSRAAFLSDIGILTRRISQQLSIFIG
jgi:O-antigen/teichoic acid export membrane protein